jgi:hypothetical protein
MQMKNSRDRSPLSRADLSETCRRSFECRASVAMGVQKREAIWRDDRFPMDRGFLCKLLTQVAQSPALITMQRGSASLQSRSASAIAPS